MENTLKEHWNKVYDSNDLTTLGWYEDDPKPSFDLITKCNLNKDAAILDVGSGATTLIDKLLSNEYTNITTADISKNSLDKLTDRLGDENRKCVTSYVDDITDSRNLPEGLQVDLWHDRTVLHFLIDKDQQVGYLKTLKNVVKVGGYVIIAVFSLEGAKKCSGLDVKNYDENMIAEFLGNEFELIEYFNHVYIQPSGNERPFVYTLFKRNKTIEILQ